MLVNIDANSASGQITGRIGAVDQARGIFTGLQRGEIDRSLFTISKALGS